MLNGCDQMEKGPRFIWFDWSQAVSSAFCETDEYVEFVGKAQVFRQISNNIIHTRRVRKYKNQLLWEVEDDLLINKPIKIRQIWNPAVNLPVQCSFIPQSKVEIIQQKGFFSGYYGLKEETTQTIFETNETTIQTQIKASYEA
jgi:hypothetical protein